MGLFTLLRGSAKPTRPAPSPTSPHSPTARSSPTPTSTAVDGGYLQDLSLAKLTGAWVLDPTHSTVGFAARHALVTRVRGTFSEFSGIFHLDPEHLDECSAEVIVQMASVDTRVAQRDEHLRSADFFDTERYPEMVFRSTAVRQREAERYRMTGDLTIRGHSHPVDIDLVYSGSVVDSFGVERIGLDGIAYVNRGDWGLTWNANLETGGMLVSEKIKLEFDISAIRVA
uniref:Lipid/polyisoprenoid-binding YceI-like domain-containing protein n=1 Tax=Streptomyces sp. CNQ-418 TaxID=467194 RepID=J7H3Q5_9ACTN|nr:hypothetical protein [Streptomyces sp. CNQ-418]